MTPWVSLKEQSKRGQGGPLRSSPSLSRWGGRIPKADVGRTLGLCASWLVLCWLVARQPFEMERTLPCLQAGLRQDEAVQGKGAVKQDCLGPREARPCVAGFCLFAVCWVWGGLVLFWFNPIGR